MKRFHWLAGLLLLSCALLTQARDLPHNTLRGNMTTDVYPDVIINGKLRTLAVGNQVRDERNHMRIYNKLPAGSYNVAYLEDKDGKILRVWILTEDEAAESGPVVGPSPRQQ